MSHYIIIEIWKIRSRKKKSPLILKLQNNPKKKKISSTIYNFKKKFELCKEEGGREKELPYGERSEQERLQRERKRDREREGVVSERMELVAINPWKL